VHSASHGVPLDPQTGLEQTHVAYRDDTLSTLLSLTDLYVLMDGQEQYFPPAGFVGQASSSLVLSGPRPSRLVSIRLQKRASTPNAPPWRLTLEWVSSRPPLPIRRFSASSAHAGR